MHYFVPNETIAKNFTQKFIISSQDGHLKVMEQLTDCMLAAFSVTAK